MKNKMRTTKIQPRKFCLFGYILEFHTVRLRKNPYLNPSVLIHEGIIIVDCIAMYYTPNILSGGI